MPRVEAHATQPKDPHLQSALPGRRPPRQARCASPLKTGQRAACASGGPVGYGGMEGGKARDGMGADCMPSCGVPLQTRQACSARFNSASAQHLLPPSHHLAEQNTAAVASPIQQFAYIRLPALLLHPPPAAACRHAAGCCRACRACRAAASCCRAVRAGTAARAQRVCGKLAAEG